MRGSSPHSSWLRHWLVRWALTGGSLYFVTARGLGTGQWPIRSRALYRFCYCCKISGISLLPVVAVDYFRIFGYDSNGQTLALPMVRTSVIFWLFWIYDSRCPFSLFAFYRASSYARLASAVLAVVILSVRPSVCFSVTRVLCDTRSSANAEEPCEHTVRWNRVKCCTNVRRIALENVCKRWMTFKVIQGHCRCYHLIGYILFPISLSL